MSNLPGAEDPRLFDLWTQLLGDLERGALPALEHYLARFPGLEAEVEREYRAATARHWPNAGLQDGREGDAAASASNANATRQLLDRLARHPPRLDRYDIKGEIGRGGMGVVHKAFDDDLRRTIAMKVARRSNERATASFLDEAQITGQLDHPGIVPVHELGIDREGTPFFTMKLVQGRTLAEIFRLVEEGDKEWTKTRALNALLRVCEAMAYAHSKGVIHRDLKPTNVMCGAFGEVYVMDWGLARVLGNGDSETHSTDVNRGRTALRIRTTREDELESTPDSPLATREGDVVGTPHYMPPEQASGNRESLSARSDVYSVGAILYELLSGQAPYASAGEKRTHAQVLMRVLQGPPAALLSMRSGVPAELAAICQKAMARDPAERYPDMAAMAADLRASLEQRVVSAYRVGAWQEFKKWCARNRMSAALAGVTVILALGTIVALGIAVKNRNRKILAEQASRDAMAAAVATHQVSAVQSEPGTRAGIMRSCLEDERALELLSYDLAIQASEPGSRSTARAELQARVDTIEQDAIGWPDVPKSMRQNAQNAREPNAKTLTSRFAGGAEEERAAQIVSLVESLAADAPEAWSVSLSLARARLARAGRTRTAVEDVLFPSPESRDDHDRLVTFVGRLSEFCDPDPRIGVTALYTREFEESRAKELVPLGPDPRSGFLEFVNTRTGTTPTRLSDGRLDLDQNSGVVLVLVPAVHALEREASHAASEERPPYYMSKQELTLGQWWRAGNLPSAEGARAWQQLSIEQRRLALMLPVVNVSWCEAAIALRRVGLQIASEEQWESAASADTDSSERPLNAVPSSGDQGATDRGASPVVLPSGAATALCVCARAASGRENGLGIRGLERLPAEWTSSEWRSLGSEPAPQVSASAETHSKLRVIRGLESTGEGPAGALRLRTSAGLDDRSSELGIRAVRPKAP